MTENLVLTGKEARKDTGPARNTHRPGLLLPTIKGAQISYQLTVDSIDELRLSQFDLLQTFSNRSRIESATVSETELVHIGWSYMLAPFDDSYPLPELRH